jgi:protein-disulfide isomerase
MDLIPPSSPAEDLIPTPAPPKPPAPRYRTRPYHVHAAFLPVVLLVGIGIGYLLWDRPAAPAQSSPQPTAAAAAAAGQPAPKRYDIPVAESDPILGPKDAPVTVIMYSDYECPYCRKWYGEVFKTLVDDYDGKIRFVYKDFPLYGLHADAAPAAEAARCAGEQGKYWEYQDMLFTAPEGLGDSAYQKYVQNLSLDASKFSDCAASRRYKATVEADYQYAANLGIQSTPTFFINGLAIVGAQPLEVFQQAIDAELSGKTN